jgi:hypothetical protein
VKNNLLNLKYFNNSDSGNFYGLISKVISTDVLIKNKFLADKLTVINNFKNDTYEAYKQFNTVNKAKSLQLQI